MNEEPAAPTKSPARALMLGFMPAALNLAASGIVVALKLNKNQSVALLLLAVVGGLVCSITASVMLFRRKTSLAIFGGVFFLIFGFAIALGGGCMVVLSGMD